jgi:hypothetical protein
MFGYGLLRRGGYKKYEANCLYFIILVPGGNKYGPNFDMTMITALASVKRGKIIWRDGGERFDHDQNENMRELKDKL